MGTHFTFVNAKVKSVWSLLAGLEWVGGGRCFGNQGLKFNGPLSNTFSVETHGASSPGSVGKGSSRSYITLIYWGERERRRSEDGN